MVILVGVGVETLDSRVNIYEESSWIEFEMPQVTSIKH